MSGMDPIQSISPPPPPLPFQHNPSTHKDMDRKVDQRLECIPRRAYLDHDVMSKPVLQREDVRSSVMARVKKKLTIDWIFMTLGGGGGSIQG